MIKILFIIVLCISIAGVSAQTIRKPWSELTTSEKSAFVNAVKDLSSSDVANLANEHATLFGNSVTLESI